MEGRVPSRPAVSAAAPLVEMELDLPKNRAIGGARDNLHLPPTSTTLSALWRAGFHPGQQCQRQLRWSRWNSTFQQKPEPQAEPGTTSICRPPAPSCLLYGGPGSIPASNVGGDSAGRDGTRPSTKSQSHRRSQEQPAFAAPPAPRGLLYGGPGSIPASSVTGDSAGRDGTRPSKKNRAAGGARDNQHLPPTSTTLAALWRAGFHPGQQCQRRLRWSRWNSTFQKKQSRRRSQGQPTFAAHQHHAVCFMEGRVPSRPAVLAATPLVEMELDLPKKARATSGARNNQHLPPTSTTLSAL